MHNPELSKAICFTLFLLSSVCVHVGVDVGVDVCKQIFVDMYVEASGQAQVSFLRNAIYRFGFSLVVYWFWW